MESPTSVHHSSVKTQTLQVHKHRFLDSETHKHYCIRFWRKWFIKYLWTMKAGVVEQWSWAWQCRSGNHRRRQDGSPVWVCDSWWRRGYWVARWVSLAWAWATASWRGRRHCHGVMGFSLSLSRSRLSLSFLFFVFFPFFFFVYGFSIWFWGLTNCWFFIFLFIFFTYRYFKVFMGFENFWAGWLG